MRVHIGHTIGAMGRWRYIEDRVTLKQVDLLRMAVGCSLLPTPRSLKVIFWSWKEKMLCSSAFIQKYNIHCSQSWCWNVHDCRQLLVYLYDVLVRLSARSGDIAITDHCIHWAGWWLYNSRCPRLANGLSFGNAPKSLGIARGTRHARAATSMKPRKWVDWHDIYQRYLSHFAIY